MMTKYVIISDNVNYDTHQKNTQPEHTHIETHLTDGIKLFTIRPVLKSKSKRVRTQTRPQRQRQPGQ